MGQLVCCDACNGFFSEVMPGSWETRQGYKCSVSATRYGLRGHYGSVKHDGNIYEWVKPEVADFSEQGELVYCDACVDDMISKGEIKLKEQSVYF